MQAEADSFQKLQPEDRQAMRAKYNSIMFSLKEDASESPDIYAASRYLTDPAKSKAQAGRIKRILDRDDSLCPKTDTERAKLDGRMREIEDYLRRHTLTNGEVWATVKTSGQSQFERAVKKAMFWNSPEVMKLVEEWRSLKNRLEPEDPMADDIEILSKGVL